MNNYTFSIGCLLICLSINKLIDSLVPVVCPAKCGNGTCTVSGECCSDTCLICHDNDPHKCEVCRHLSVGELNGIQCAEKCPSQKYKHQNRRCISDKQCRAVPKPTSVNLEYKVPGYPYIPFMDDCTIDCPTGYYPEGESGHRVCKVCEGKCKKECSGGTIDSIAVAQRYRGCTFITETLTIQIRSQGGRKYTARLPPMNDLMQQ